MMAQFEIQINQARDVERSGDVTVYVGYDPGLLSTHSRLRSLWSVLASCWVLKVVLKLVQECSKDFLSFSLFRSLFL